MISFYIYAVCVIISGIQKIFWYNKDFFEMAVASGAYNLSAEAINNTMHRYQMGKMVLTK